jgi:hypothetical protein
MKSLGWAEMAIGLEDEERLLKRKLIKRPRRATLQAEIERPAFECNCLVHSGQKKKWVEPRATTAGSGEQ